MTHHVTLADGSAMQLAPRASGTAPSLVWAMVRAREAGVPVPEALGLQTIPSDGGVRAAMVDLGRTLGILNAVGTPGTCRQRGSAPPRW